MTKPLTRTKLDEIVHKSNAEDGIVHIDSKCHPHAPTYVSYVSGLGWLVIHCSVCGKHLVNIAVSPAFGDEIRAMTPSVKAVQKPLR
jgi:hypothetical protein